MRRRVWWIVLAIIVLAVAGVVLAGVLASSGRHTHTGTVTVETQPTHT